MSKPIQQFRRWLAMCLTMMLVITGVIPALSIDTAKAATTVLTFTDSQGTAITDGATLSAPKDAGKRVTDLYVKYDGTGPTDIEVYLNGKMVQKQTNVNTAGPHKINDLDLSPGLNTVRVYSTAESQDVYIYYKYMPADMPIILDGYAGKGTDPFNAEPFGSSKITLKGVFGAGVNGNALRLKITLGNGQIVSGLEKLAPSISGSTFTFYDVALQPGLNKITFYETVGSVVKEHLHFYVNYNNTPILEELKIEDIDLSPVGTTLVTVPRANQLILDLNGIAKNADTVEVQNAATGETLQAAVSSSTGFFAINLPAKFGENLLRISAYNQNKKIGIFERKILVVTTTPNEADLLYGVKINEKELDPDVPFNLDDTVTTVKLSAEALVQFVDDPVAKKELKSFEFVLNDTDPLSSASEIVIPAEKTKNETNNGFTRYSIKVDDIPALTVGHQYELTLRYNYDAPDSNGTIVSNPVNVGRFTYLINFVDGNKPQFISATYSNGVLSTTGTNVISKVPEDIKIAVKKMDLPAGSDPNSVSGSRLKIYLNNKELKSSDYSFSYSSADDEKIITLKIINPDVGNGVLKLVYDTASDPSKPPLPTDPADRFVAVEYNIKWQIAPYAQLTYVDSLGNVKSFYDGFEINSESDIPTLDGRVYNFTINSARTNIEAKLNTSTITLSGLSDTAFRIDKTKWKDKLKKGDNTLQVTLMGATPVVYTYKILYVTSKAPSIGDVKLSVIHNGDNTELTQKTGGTDYDTGAAFLSNFSFTVNDATHVYIEKNGKRIVDYRYASSKWTQDKSNKEYTDTLSEIPTSLQSRFDTSNFSDKTKTTFEAKLSATQYNSILKDVQDVVTKSEEQEATLSLFPLNLRKNNNTVYTIVAEDENGTVVRYNITIAQKTNSWEVISPRKAKPEDKYITVNSNSVPIKIFAEKADKVLFGKVEATVTNTKDPDFVFDKDLAKAIPETYYVFTATVPLKKGLNTIKYSVVVGNSTHNDQIQIYNADSAVDGAESRDVLGKKVSFSVFDKALQLKFPSGTVLLAPSSNRAGEETKNPTKDIFVDVPLYFGIADRTTGQVSIEGDSLKSRLGLDSNFNYGSPLYYIDAGDTENPGGRDPYYDESDGEEFKDRYQENLVPSKQGTLKIQYDTSIVNAANNVLTVYYHDGKEWRNIGGVVNTGQKSITVPFSGFGYYMVMKNRESFEDVVTHDFARDAMETLYSKGIMPAYSGSSFGANRDMTRGEFATMLVKALALPIKAGPYRDSNEKDPVSPTFVDVRPSRDTWDYQYKYVETAARAGIIRGKQPGYFRPDDSLTREEAAIMIARALNLKLGTLDTSKIALDKMFTDAKDVGYYAAPSVLAVSKAKLMNGEPNDPTAKKPTYSFKPTNNLTRAEMAIITVRVMVQLKKLPKQ